jgi:biopolymer transport protein ExbB
MPGDATFGLWELFKQSFDVFTVLLVSGSLVGVTWIFLCLFEVRERNIVPPEVVGRLRDLASAGRWEDLQATVRMDDSFVSRVVRSAAALMGSDRTAIRDAAELAAGEESARWFRRIDLLNIIGNLGPLVGLAGTVWGMILAFTSLGATGGQAQAAELSVGISKALFHTLLGLCLAIPCLLFYGLFRGRVDRLCTRAIVEAGEIVERLPARDASGVLA